MTAPTVMILRGFADGKSTPYDGQYLKAFDFEAGNGVGLATLTPNPAEAMRFASLAEALAYRARQPLCRPLRPDGHPNRPLTSSTWEFGTLGGTR